ncbi:PTS system%2C mannose/fructose/N-acetylgalactosamine-specific component IIA [Staphylococcus aureus]|nr:PTS system%2C mannose/fructose/N-acetylgalactosamine-specific component IIA [Staphylococcus aureus]
MIIAKGPDQFLELANYGVDIDTLNVGNMSQTEETRSIKRSINVTDKDIETFRKIHEKGIKIVSQMVPNDNSEDFMSLIQ